VSLPSVTEEHDGYSEVEVYYGTDRFATGSPVPELRYGPQRSGASSLHLGVLKVSVPHFHHPGEIEEPSIWRFEFRPDPNKHMVLLGVSPLSPNSFYGRMKQTLDRSQRRELLVFVHGYNVSFATAALRTAQLAYDLKLDGAPVLYSWPSQAALAGYPVDETNVEWTVPHLEAFLTDLAQRSGASSIDLIAHSMGNRALTRALERIGGKMTATAKPPFRQILLTAPDVDAGVFSQIAQVFRKTGQRVTLYASSNDQALKASKSFHGFPRAGDTVPDIVVLPDLDTVDVSLVDTGLLGHSYYGDNTSVLTDIFHLLRDGKPPDQRGLKPRTKNGMAYWAFVP